MNCIIFNYDTRKVITTLQLYKAKGGLADITDLIYKRQMEKDILGLGAPCRLERTGFGLGISEYYKYDGYIDTISSKGGVAKLVTGKNSFVYGDSGKEASKPGYICYYDEDGNKQNSTLRLGIFAYPEGYILSTGKIAYNIFGGGGLSYLEKITSKNFKSSTKTNCRKFKDFKSMLKYVQDNLAVFAYMSKRYGYKFEWSYASPEYEKDIKEFYRKKNNKKMFAEDESRNELERILDECNNPVKELENIFPEPDCETAGKEMMKAEAILRMRELNLMSTVIINFKKDILMQSEFGGILYFINDKAEKAIELVKQRGYIPYHVVVNDNMGLYCVLFVSPDTSRWTEERPNRYGEIYNCFCYNADEPLFSEEGYAKFIPASGGLVRAA